MIDQSEMGKAIELYTKKLKLGAKESWSGEDLRNLGWVMNHCSGKAAIDLWALLNGNFPVMFAVHPHVYERVIRIAKGEDDGTYVPATR